MKKFTNHVNESNETDNNDFYTKYKEVEWREDGRDYFQKITTVITKKYPKLETEVKSDSKFELTLDIYQLDKKCSIIWSFDEVEYEATIRNASSNIIKTLSGIEKYLKSEGFMDELQTENKELDDAENCKCDKGKKEDCDCGKDCGCDTCSCDNSDD